MVSHKAVKKSERNKKGPRYSPLKKGMPKPQDRVRISETD